MNTKNAQLLEQIKNRAEQAPHSSREWGLLVDVCEIDTSIEHVPTLKQITRQAASVLSNKNPFPPAATPSTSHSEAWINVYWRAMRVLARVDFDAFLIYVERYRAPEKRFYGPRRKILHPLVSILNDIEMGINHDYTNNPIVRDFNMSGPSGPRELILNMPARVGKTGVMTFFATWVMGRESDRTNIYSAFSAEVTDGFYEKVLAILTDTDIYAYDEIFPGAPMVEKHADKTTIDVGHKMHYPSLTCRTIDGSLNGVCDASGYIFADDLVKGTEEARSPGRLSSKQKKVNNDLLKRESGNNLKIVWMGTNWSPHDPMASRKRLLKSDPAFKDYNWVHVAMPGVDEKGNSNFDYDYGVGFTTEQYARDKAKFIADDDLAGWETQVMCNPTEYHGILFPETSLITYNGTLPPSEHLRTIMFVDPAWGGGDSCAAPVCQIVQDEQGREIRAIPAVVCTSEGKDVSIPQIVALVKSYNVAHVYVEANKMTREFADKLQTEIKRAHKSCSVTTIPAPNNVSKEYRIWDKAPDIKQLWFLSKDKRNPDYNAFMGQVNTFNPEGGNKQDGGPDSLAGLVTVLENPYMPSVTTGRLW